MRVARAAIVAVLLVATTAACQMDVTLDTTIARDGSGTFALRFEADKELVDLARNTGQDPFTPLGELSEDLQRRGWRVTRSTPRGGLSVGIERRFSSPGDLNRALAALEAEVPERGGPARGFFHVEVGRSSGFLRSRTSFEGSMDLSTDSLLGESDLTEEAKNTLRPIVEQAAGEFFRFTVRVALPGDISSATGDPDRTRGGTVTWSPELGKKVTITASSSAYSMSGFLAIGVPVVLVIAIVVVLLLRRRRRVRD